MTRSAAASADPSFGVVVTEHLTVVVPEQIRRSVGSH
jgi:hypothetical protein